MGLYQTITFSFVVIFGYLSFSDGCSFPLLLTGNWVSADRGVLTFSSNQIQNYMTYGPMGLVNMDCVNKSENTYLLQSSKTISMFGKTTNFFLCLEIQYMTNFSFQYFIGTEMDDDTLVKDYLFALTDAVATIEQACNRVKPYAQHTYIMLVKEGSVEDGSLGVNCPDFLFARYSNVTVDGVSCADSSLDVCSNRTTLNTTISAGCAKNIFSDGGQQKCIYYTTTNDITYLSVWNEDTTITEPTTFRFSCYALKQSGNDILATETPRFCSDNTTHTSPGVQLVAAADPRTKSGNVIVVQSVTETCPIIGPTQVAPDETPDSTDWTLYFIIIGAVGGYLLLSVLALLAACLCLRLRARAQTKQKASDKSIARGEVCCRKQFFLHSYMLRKNENTNYFRPKIPLKPPPLKPEWHKHGLFITKPTSKITPIYLEPVSVQVKSLSGADLCEFPGCLEVHTTEERFLEIN